MMVKKSSIPKKLREEEAEVNTAAANGPDAQVPRPFFAVFLLCVSATLRNQPCQITIKFLLIPGNSGVTSPIANLI